MDQTLGQTPSVPRLEHWREKVRLFEQGLVKPPYLPANFIWFFLLTNITHFAVMVLDYSPNYWHPELAVAGVAPSEAWHEWTPGEWALFAAVYLSLALFCLLVFNYHWSLVGWLAAEMVHFYGIGNWLDGCHYSRWSLTIGHICDSLNGRVYWLIVALLLGIMMSVGLNPGADSIPGIQFKRKAPLVFTAFSLLWVILLFASVKTSTSTPQTGWRQLNLERNPVPLVDAVYAYDTDRDVLVVFGGKTLNTKNKSVYTHQTWEWDGERWKDVSLSPKDSPDVRVNSAMAYDPHRGVMVLYGGYGKTGYKCDTWEWDGQKWAGKCPPKCPGARAGHFMYFDPIRGHVVLYGGYDKDKNFNDTWEWDGETWTEIEINRAGPTSSDFSLAYNQNDNYLFGLANGIPNVSWTFKAGMWTHFTPTNQPDTREGWRMAFDPLQNRFVLFGGKNRNLYFNDTWFSDGTNWQPYTDSLFTPSLRSNSVIWYDETRQHVMLFGGGYETHIYNDTWELAPGEK